MVTHSLIVQLSPIIAKDSSPPNFKSCGTAEITAPGNILQFFSYSCAFHYGNIRSYPVPSPITTLLWIVKGSMTTFFGDFRQDEHMLRVDSSTFFYYLYIYKTLK
jgi:hypothetical protein